MAARFLLATGMIATTVLSEPPAKPTTSWENLIADPKFVVDVDKNSVKVIVRNNGYEVLTTMKMSFNSPILVPGQTKVGAYYVNELSAKCSTDELSFEKSTLYTAAGEAIATVESPGSIKNPKNPKSFVTIWIHLSCAKFKGKRPPLVI